ncbi:uncharacterized protein N7503_003881 [Penicillium pulvis]|uniref:uncharacterized protein n=1 Tax=Penicillium pulvis TaxID=1562058 RepID=UPI002546CB31|nr:uncharacterized protein N7503_003881 [Penicillium pulvis]KAJ5806279.1 hypothetical protein N7503_003881 [Penicillium pulvis]
MFNVPLQAILSAASAPQFHYILGASLLPFDPILTSQPMALLKLANELLGIIGSYIDSQISLYALVRTCRRLHTLFIRPLHRLNITRHNFSALCYLSEHGQEKIIRRFLAEDAYLPPQVQRQWRFLIGSVSTRILHPLSGAAKNGHEAVIKLLLFELGASPNIRDAYMSFPLNWAAENGHLGVAELLVESGGADVCAPGRQRRNPLASAGIYGHVPVMQYLFSMIVTQGKNDPIQEAINALIHMIPSSWPDNIEASLFLVDAVQDVNIYMPVQTPLSLAAQHGRVDLVEALLDRGADIEKRAREQGRTPLISAAMYRQVEVIWVLLAAGANPNIVDGMGSTPLHYAAEAGMDTAVRLLLAKNADASFKDGKTGRTPREWALEKGHQDVAALLLSSLRNE